jgi:hypothetical protein
VDEFAALMVTALLLGAAYGGGYVLGIVIRRIRGVDDPNREEKRKSKQQRREEKKAARGLPRGWARGRFPPRVPRGQPTWTQEPQQPPNQNIYFFIGPRGSPRDSEESEDGDAGPRQGRGRGSYGSGGMFPGGGRRG